MSGTVRERHLCGIPASQIQPSGGRSYGVPQLARASVAAFSVSPVRPACASSLRDFPKLGGSVAVNPGVRALTNAPAQLFAFGGASARAAPTPRIKVVDAATTNMPALRNTWSPSKIRTPRLQAALRPGGQGSSTINAAAKENTLGQPVRRKPDVPYYGLLLRLAEDGVRRGHVLVERSLSCLGGGGLTCRPGVRLCDYEDASTLAAACVPTMGKCGGSRNDPSEHSSSRNTAKPSRHPQPSLPPNGETIFADAARLVNGTRAITTVARCSSRVPSPWRRRHLRRMTPPFDGRQV